MNLGRIVLQFLTQKKGSVMMMKFKAGMLLAMSIGVANAATDAMQ